MTLSTQILARLKKETPEQLDQKITIALAYTNGRRDRAAKIIGLSIHTFDKHLQRRRKE